MNFKDNLTQKTTETEAVIKAYLPAEEGYQKTVLEAMNYSFLVGGKRLRPLLMKESFALFGGEGDLCNPFMAAIEMIHTYSLVHDDLPEMDNDELRRGMPTTHVKYGVDMAVLAGDGLLNYAFETALQAFDVAGEKEFSRVVHAMKVLARKAGVYGMIGGQTLDVEAEKKGIGLGLPEVSFIDEHKTAALLQASLMIGAILAGAGEEEVHAMETIGYNVGVAFQIQDDILDITSSTEVLGKPVGSDEKNSKVTYVSLMGMEAAEEKQKSLSDEAVTLLRGLGKEASFMEELILSLVHRKM
ncbi:MAG: polyprenyl synthetase family protein [Lachnospiraceae bacterium]|nr:polyprenyl synthetase family protein [Lachnospiraceae bacterium]MBQ8261368.1 polyprenyl synthetase family protein [Lachnospiraceae bacterium]